MTKKDIIDLLADHLGVSKAKTDDALAYLTQAMTQTLAAGGEVKFHGFGRFYVKDRAERVGRNPQTGEAIKIPAAKAVKFKPHFEV